MSTLTIRTVPMVRRAGGEAGAGSLRSAPARSLAARWLAVLLREYRVWRDLRRVETLDSRMLHDIGLAPGSLEDAVRHGRGGREAASARAAAARLGLPGSSNTEWR